MANVANSRYFSKGKTGSAIRDNGAGVTYGGTIGGTNVTLSLGKDGLATARKGNRVPTAADTGVDYTAKAISGGDFANIHTGRYLITGMIGYIAGVANTTLGTTGRVGSLQLSTNRRESVSTTLARTAGWNYVTGAFLTTPTANTTTFKAIDGSANIDRAARTTRSAPGNIYYIVGKVPTVKALSARTQ